MPRLALPHIDPDRCTGCGRCVAACPPQVLWLQSTGPMGWGDKYAQLQNAAACTGCARCQQVCPFTAIRMQRSEREPSSR